MVHIFEDHLAAHVLQLDGVRGVLDLRHRVQHLEDALTAGHRALELGVLHHQRADRLVEPLHGDGEEDHRADGH